MSVQVRIHDGPLGPATPWAVQGAGAVLCFEGIVRPQESGRLIAGLDYDVYESMARRLLDALAREALRRFGVLAMAVEHSRGLVGPGACSFRLRVASAHRQEALAAADWFIDRMKQEVPIWKGIVRSATAEAVEEHAP